MSECDFKNVSTLHIIVVAKTQTVSHRPHAADSRFYSQAATCRRCSRKSVTWTGFSPSASVVSCQYDSTNAPYSFSHHRRHV